MTDRLDACVEALTLLAYKDGKECRWCHRFVGLDHGSECPIRAMAQGLSGVATAPSTPEPALDVERLAKAIHASHEHPNLAGCLDMDRDSADLLAREYAAFTSEPRAAAPQTKPEDAG